MVKCLLQNDFGGFNNLPPTPLPLRNINPRVPSPMSQEVEEVRAAILEVTLLPSCMTLGKSFDFLVFSFPFCIMKTIMCVLSPPIISFDYWVISLSTLIACIPPEDRGCTFLNVKKLMTICHLLYRLKKPEIL